MVKLVSMRLEEMHFCIFGEVMLPCKDLLNYCIVHTFLVIEFLVVSTFMSLFAVFFWYALSVCS